MVGDVTLQAGTFLLLDDNNSNNADIHHYTATNVGVGTTTGAASVLIDADDINIGSRIRSVELVEETTIIGGTTLASGTILGTLGASIGPMGDNLVAVDKYDVFALDLATTARARSSSCSTVRSAPAPKS